MTRTLEDQVAELERENGELRLALRMIAGAVTAAVSTFGGTEGAQEDGSGLVG